MRSNRSEKYHLAVSLDRHWVLDNLYPRFESWESCLSLESSWHTSPRYYILFQLMSDKPGKRAPDDQQAAFNQKSEESINRSINTYTTLFVFRLSFVSGNRDNGFQKLAWPRGRQSLFSNEPDSTRSGQKQYFESDSIYPGWPDGCGTAGYTRPDYNVHGPIRSRKGPIHSFVTIAIKLLTTLSYIYIPHGFYTKKLRSKKANTSLLESEVSFTALL